MSPISDSIANDLFLQKPALFIITDSVPVLDL
jgi:hypothetical protein